MGTLFSELLLDEQAPLGTYYIEVRDPAASYYIGTSFRVAEYKKPEFEVAVGTDWDPGCLPERRVHQRRAEATYYFGGPGSQLGSPLECVEQLTTPSAISVPWGELSLV